ncbi:hypothetical protein G1C97_0685 [Bifidobacterium sp. DSM 109959]|uniref:Uncharacterized protein n=1 Tax=Bifidobacterium olomucense TaxID=2675324 RepID=A0A7Y0EYN3_9BIFI|nr:hypothetical protein [Bifidobacterium sp. DSM 109959]
MTFPSTDEQWDVQCVTAHIPCLKNTQAVEY